MPKYFQKMQDLERHAKQVEREIRMTTTRGLRFAAKEVLAEVRRIPGHYQPAEGQFPAWAPLAQETMERRARKGVPTNEPELVTSELRNSYDVAFDGNQASIGSNLKKALLQEQGNPARNLPARPILGPAFVRVQKRAFKVMYSPLEIILKD